jgi:methylmalonyl-CoA mutase cobalamin-binding subunit
MYWSWWAVLFLKRTGIDGVFGPGTASEDYVNFIYTHLRVAS